MFPLKPRDELVFGISNNSNNAPSQNIPFPVNHHLQNNHIVDHAHNFQFCNTRSTTISFSSSKDTEKPRTGVPARGRDQADIMSKRAMHRNIERQRRQQMSELYSSLRSLLPLHHIKGKHSLSDLMHESKDYIQKLQNNVQELRDRRDKMKKLSITNSSSAEMISTSSNGIVDTRTNLVEVNKEQHGIEILITTSTSEYELSPVMKELMISDLNVISSVSTRINGNFVHKIHAEASDLSLVDQSELRERLTGVIN